MTVIKQLSDTGAKERRDWYLFQLSNWSANCLNLWEATAKGNLYQNALVP